MGRGKVSQHEIEFQNPAQFEPNFKAGNAMFEEDIANSPEASDGNFAAGASTSAFKNAMFDNDDEEQGDIPEREPAKVKKKGAKKGAKEKKVNSTDIGNFDDEGAAFSPCSNSDNDLKSTVFDAGRGDSRSRSPRSDGSQSPDAKKAFEMQGGSAFKTKAGPTQVRYGLRKVKDKYLSTDHDGVSVWSHKYTMDGEECMANTHWFGGSVENPRRQFVFAVRFPNN